MSHSVSNLVAKDFSSDLHIHLGSGSDLTNDAVGAVGAVGC